MKRKTCAMLAAWLVLAGSATAAKPKELSVQVREGVLRASPSALGAVVSTVKYGDRLSVLEESGSWVKLAAPGGGAAGWIHVSALTSKRVALKAGQGDAQVAASSGELATAGKGFNADVEKKFKEAHGDADFRWVDRMEKLKVAPREATAFLEKGGVAPEKGGGK